MEYWREFAENTTGIQADIARQVLDKVAQVPELLEPIEDLHLVEDHRTLIDTLISAVLPLGASEETYAAAILPFQPITFFASPGFEKLDLVNHLLSYFSAQDDFMTTGKALKAYSTIYYAMFNQDLVAKLPMFCPVREDDSGLVRYFKIDFDTRFIKIVTRGEIPVLSEPEKEKLIEERLNLDLWRTLLPAEHFEFHGFAILNAVEVTEGQVISAIQRDLLSKDALSSPSKLDIIQSRIRSLIRQPSLEIGLISIERGEFDSITSIQPLGRSLLLSMGSAPNCPLWAQSVYSSVSHEWVEPKVIPDLEQYPERTGFEEYLLRQGYRSLILAPLYSEDRLVGILELGSKNAHDLNAASLLYLKEVTSLIAVAVHRELTEKEDRIQAIIKQQYTSIHPTVEWRFRKAAKHYLEDQNRDGTARAESIVFQNIYPLYGLSDIRGSSNERNYSIQTDLIEQLRLAHSVLVEAQKYRPLYAIEEILFRIEKHMSKVDRELRSGDEITILQFLKDDVTSLFEELASFDRNVALRIQEYRQAIDPEVQVLYRKRKEYEESVRMINNCISTFIEACEVEAQKMYPHFFEMFKTDGVDYNLYVGESLVENRSYNELYLKNLRLWQLKTMCGVHWEMEKLLPNLPVPLKTAHLILVQNIPISIRFRVDEKKFDVDGAYNIRYEIVKKRIDKAIIKGTKERLTQPGKIAIVYSQEEESQEYRRYINYLLAAGYFKGEVEDLELGDLQGVHGLKALRIDVADTNPSSNQGEEEAPLITEWVNQNGDGISSIIPTVARIGDQ